jgi:hypothetical protein
MPNAIRQRPSEEKPLAPRSPTQSPLSALTAKSRVALYRGMCFVDGSVHILTLYIDIFDPCSRNGFSSDGRYFSGSLLADLYALERTRLLENLGCQSKSLRRLRSGRKRRIDGGECYLINRISHGTMPRSD